jgi:hypothetical protein
MSIQWLLNLAASVWGALKARALPKLLLLSSCSAYFCIAANAAHKANLFVFCIFAAAGGVRCEQGKDQKRSIRSANASQEGGNMGFVADDGQFEGSFAVTVAHCVGDNSNASARGVE